MATTMFASATLSATAWTEIVDGTTYSAVSVQHVSSDAVAIAVATAQPAADTEAFLVLSRIADPSWSGKLDANEKLWARALNSSGKLRGARVAR